MIARVWKGWAKKENADEYESLLRNKMFPEMKKTIKGYHGGYILRQNGENECEFVTVNFFDSLETVKAMYSMYGGTDYTKPVFDKEAEILLSRVEDIAYHYEVKATPEDFS